MNFQKFCQVEIYKKACEIWLLKSSNLGAMNENKATLFKRVERQKSPP